MAQRDPTTGLIVEAEQAAPSGELTSVMAPDGSFTEMPLERAQLAIRDYGFKLDSPELRREQELQQQYGEGLGNELAAGGLGFARGTTFGLSDLALGESGLVSREALRELEARNPDASMAGEIASFALPAMGAIKTLGAVGKAARIAGAGIEAASAVGRGVEAGASLVGGGLARGLGLKTGGVAADVLGTLAPRALGIGAEAELYQIGHNLSQAVMKDEELTAETLLAHSENSLMLGGALGLAGPLAARAGRALVDRAIPDIARVTVKEGANKALKKVAEFFDPDNSLQLFSGLKGNTPKRFPEAVRAARDAGFYRPGEVKFDPQSLSFKQVAKGALPDREAAVLRLEQGLKDVGDEMGRVLKAGDGVQLSADLARFGLKDQKRIGGMLQDWRKRRVISEPELNRLADMAADIATGVSEAGGNLRALHELRMGLDQRIGGKNWEALKSEEIEMIKDLRRVVSDKIEEGVGELAARGIVKDNSWKQLNKIYGSLAQIQAPLEKSIQQAKAWVNVGGLRWRDLLLSGVGAPAGAAVGGFVGGDDGAKIGGLVGGSFGVANKIFQTERGLLWRAQIGERLGALVAANNATLGVGQRIASAATKFARSEPVAATINTSRARAPSRVSLALTDEREHQQELAAARNSQDRYRVMTQKLSQLMSNPAATAERMSLAMRGADHLSPGIRDKLISKQLQIYSFLNAKAPKDPLAAHMINPAHSGYKPSDGEIARWERHVRAAQRPLSILDDLRKNEVTPEGAETIRVLYPKLFKEIQAEILQKVAAASKQPKYEDRAQLGLLFDVPTDPSLAPEYFESLLARFDNADGSGAPAPATSPTARASGAAKLKVDEQQTRAELLAQ